jgi:thioredoxin-like negative regulator of GroEL
MSKMVQENEFQNALKHHQAGNFDVAALLYNKVLEQQPDNINAITLLGTVNLQKGNMT